MKIRGFIFPLLSMTYAQATIKTQMTILLGLAVYEKPLPPRRIRSCWQVGRLSGETKEGCHFFILLDSYTMKRNINNKRGIKYFCPYLMPLEE
jgi:hypothetical protein